MVVSEHYKHCIDDLLTRHLRQSCALDALQPCSAIDIIGREAFVTQVAHDVAAGLARMHAHGMVHRNISAATVRISAKACRFMGLTHSTLLTRFCAE